MLPIPATTPMILMTTWMTMQAPFAKGLAWLVALANAAAPGAVAAIWQGTAIALVAGLFLRFARRADIHIGAAQRFAVWAAAFVAIAFLPFLPSLPLRASSGGDATLGAPSSAQAFHLPYIQISERWALGLAALWLVASLVRAASLVWHSFCLHRLWSSAAPVAIDENLRGLLAGASGSRRRIVLCTTRKLDRPSVIGFFAPRILIPEWLFLRLTPDELEHVVLHEAEHLRRGDDWINLLQKLALVVFPLNPALIWIEHRLCCEREMACDEGVARRTQSPHAYAASLANLAGHALSRRRSQALSLGAFERRSELARRISSLLAFKPALHPVAARAVVGVAACSLFVGALELARCPQMVAFVSAAPAANVAQISLPATQGDRVFDQRIAASNISGFHALQAKAVLPTEQMSLRRPYGAALSGAKVRYSMSAVGGPAEAVPLLQNMPQAGRLSQRVSSFRQDTNERAASSSGSEEQATSAASQPQVVVFTAWEEIVTRHGGAVADYDTSASAQTDSTDSEAAARTQQSERAPVQITVTRLIFWIAQRPAASSIVAPGSKPARPTTSDSRQPAAPAPASGWLVFEL